MSASKPLSARKVRTVLNRARHRQRSLGLSETGHAPVAPLASPRDDQEVVTTMQMTRAGLALAEALPIPPRLRQVLVAALTQRVWLVTRPDLEAACARDGMVYDWPAIEDALKHLQRAGLVTLLWEGHYIWKAYELL